jgi:hypothetical protein
VPSGTPTAPDTATPENTAEIARPRRAGSTIEVPTTNAAAMTSPAIAPVSTRTTSSAA